MSTNYIRQAVRESQLKYPSITERPIDYFNHLFFTNGNGKEFLNGNPVEIVSFWRTIPYIEYYRDQKSFEELKEHYFDRLAETKIEKEFKYMMERFIYDGDPLEKENYFWDKACKEVNSQFDNLVLIDSISDNQLFNVSYWEKEIDISDYIPYLQISPTFYKLDEFNENTEENLLRIGLSLSKAYVNILTKYIDNPSLLNDKKPVFGSSDVDYIKIYKKDIEELKRQLKKAEK